MNVHQMPQGLPLVALVLVASGCSAVTSSQILGIPTTDKEFTELSVDGVWKMEEEAIFVRRISGHELRVAFVEWKEDHFQLQETTVLLTTDQDVPYAVALNSDSPPEKPEYFFTRVLMATDSMIVLLPPKPETFQAAVERGEIAGKVKEEQYSTLVQLSAVKADLDTFVDPAKVADQFDLEVPIVLTRLNAPKEVKSE